MTGIREQMTEIWQRADDRYQAVQPVCYLIPAKFLLPDTCYLLNVAARGRA